MFDRDRHLPAETGQRNLMIQTKYPNIRNLLRVLTDRRAQVLSFEHTLHVRAEFSVTKPGNPTDIHLRLCLSSVCWNWTRYDGRLTGRQAHSTWLFVGLLMVMSVCVCVQPIGKEGPTFEKLWVKKCYLPKAIELGQRRVSLCENTFSRGREAEAQCAVWQLITQHVVPLVNQKMMW